MADKNNGDFFVMLYTQNGGITPLTLCTEDSPNEAVIATFDSESKAREYAENSLLGDMFGYEVFERGCGC
jgi:hypothetical protein